MENLNPIQDAARRQFEERADRYGRSHILSQTDDIQSACAWLGPIKDSRVLDVATGGGHAGIFFARRGAVVTLSDLSQGMLDRAKALAESEQLSVETAVHSAESMPWEADSFDLVTCRVAGHHFSDPAGFMKEVVRVLKPGGRFLLIDGSVQDGAPTAEQWLHEVEKLRDPSHHRFLTPGAWKELSVAVGLTPLHSELQAFHQPNLEWYFETAGTSPENREAVMKLVLNPPDEAVQLFKVNCDAEGRWNWWWQRLVFVAQRVASPPF